jgi:hypothetical protein
VPLDLPSLNDDLQKLFKQPPYSESDCANAWATAMVKYTKAIVPAATGQAAAGTAMAGALSGMSASGAAPDLLKTALTAFAAAIGGSMVAPPPLKAPPASPPDLSALGTPLLDGAAQGTAVATALNTWMMTGGGGTWK